jgi:divalent metal cation (Fe/Co/Zn/Cd) transporter
MKSENSKVLIIALGANVGIAVAKFMAAALTGSSAMLTEGVHSLVDSTNQLLLMYGQKRAAKPADAIHPAGYGRELYFWSFVVALLVFALGAGVSIYEGVIHVMEPEPAVSPLIAYVVLFVAFALEGGSTYAAFREFDASRNGRSWWQALVGAKDTTNVIVLLENGAAMAEAADPHLIEGVRRHATRAGVMGVGEIMTIHNAPDQIVAAVNVDFDNRLNAGEVEQIVDAIERDLQAEFPTIMRIYIRPHEDAGLKFGPGRGLLPAT